MTNDNNWVVWMLSDSALPVGGFVASSGVESGLRMGHIYNESSLYTFIKSSLHSLAFSCLPFMSHILKVLGESIRIDTIEPMLKRIALCDFEYDALIASNHVARRISLSQGMAYLSLLSRSFPESRSNPTLSPASAANAFKNRIRSHEALGHIPITFAFSCSLLGVSHDDIPRLFLFLQARSMISAAVRLNIVGPYQGQSLLLQLEPEIQAILEECKPPCLSIYEPRPEGLVPSSAFEQKWKAILHADFDTTSTKSDSTVTNDEAQDDTHVPELSPGLGEEVSVHQLRFGVQTSPITEIIQASHDRIYSRLFHS